MAPLDGRWAPSRYHKELQRAIAFRSYISILRSGVRKKQTQESILERLYHKGETNEHGQLVQEALVDQAMQGKPPYSGLCDRHSYISIDGGTGERNEEVRLVVQDCFTRTLSVRFVIGESFTRESLSLAKLSDNKKLVSGRTLRAGAELAHRNGKRAYEFAMEFLEQPTPHDNNNNNNPDHHHHHHHDGTAESDGGGDQMELPAGKTMDDYDNYILTMMWKDQKQQQQHDGASGGREDGQNIAVRPTDWIFDGWFAFRLYGPIVDESMLEYKTDAFADPPDVVLDDPDDEVAAMVVKAEGSNVAGGDPQQQQQHLNHPFTMPSPGHHHPNNPRKRLARSSSSYGSTNMTMMMNQGPFVGHVFEEDRRHALDLAMQRINARVQLGQSEIDSLRQKALSLQKQMELELQIALAVASDDAGHESWREYRVLQRQLADVWQLIEAKHVQQWQHLDQSSCGERDLVQDYLAAVTTKKYRFDPPPPPAQMPCAQPPQTQTIHSPSYHHQHHPHNQGHPKSPPPPNNNHNHNAATPNAHAHAPVPPTTQL